MFEIRVWTHLKICFIQPIMTGKLGGACKVVHLGRNEN